MNPTPFTNMANNFGIAFGTGTQTAITSLLASVAAPLLAAVTLWIIIQGILVMRGDIDALRRPRERGSAQLPVRPGLDQRDRARRPTFAGPCFVFVRRTQALLNF